MRDVYSEQKKKKVIVSIARRLVYFQGMESARASMTFIDPALLHCTEKRQISLVKPASHKLFSQTILLYVERERPQRLLCAYLRRYIHPPYITPSDECSGKNADAEKATRKLLDTEPCCEPATPR